MAKSKIKTDEEYAWLQAMDYSCVMMTSYDLMLSQCEVIKHDQDLSGYLALILDAMGGFYQMIGRKSLKAQLRRKPPSRRKVKKVGKVNTKRSK